MIALREQPSTPGTAALNLPWQFVCKDWQPGLSTAPDLGDDGVMTTLEPSPVNARSRLKLVLRGGVQGVGFRPFVYRLAQELDLAGWVNNSPLGVFIEAEGPRQALDQFVTRLNTDKPPRSFIQSLEGSWLDTLGYNSFEIRESETGGGKTALVMPDIATCPDCLQDIFNPANRRHRYPFTNCTHCGPRFSIIEALPYDRANTSMRGFQMCPACQAEYENPNDRRFHAQPNACPACGPQLQLWPGDALAGPDHAPRSLAEGNDALLAAAHVLRCGRIVAVKGIGGFHLLVDARNATAVQRLRDRKRREEKPFALMFHTLASVREACEVSALEERLLCSSEAPIVLLRKITSRKTQIANAAAPDNPCLGVMLPSNPLHHLLMVELGFPVVATSGNVSDEPICTDEFEAINRLRGLADVFLVHNRPIVRHMDDSIVRVMLDREMILRRARGYAPLPLQVRNGERGARNILAVGAHLKNAVALVLDEQVFISQHIGDLATEPANLAFRSVIADLGTLYDTTPEVIVSDLHPDYLSTKHADELSGGAGSPRPATHGPRRIAVQHHIAHVLSCMAENELEPPALGVAWDGTGLGTDGTIWGGEFFLVTKNQVERVAHLRPFRLPGGDAAVKEPRRAALGLLHELAHAHDGLWANAKQTVANHFTPKVLATLQTMLARGLNSPPTSSVGRLFDAVSSLVGLRNTAGFEGQAAMELEFAREGIETGLHYDLTLVTGHDPGVLVLDWEPMVTRIQEDMAIGLPPGVISAKFHNALVEAIVSVARAIGEPRVVLSGGCFQNCYLTERTVKRLRAEGFHPYWHQRVPPNDGGIALGQIVAARRATSSLAPDVDPARQRAASITAGSHHLRQDARKELQSCA
jgi:hydrogenase maturation protein HypF